MSLNKLQARDAELLAACRRGDGEAWAQLIACYQRLIYAIPQRAGLDEDQCADVFQHTFKVLFEHLGRIEQPERLRAWLVTTARRETDRMKQRATRWQPLPEADDVTGSDRSRRELIDPAALPDAVVMQLEEQHLMRIALAMLDERCRQLLNLLFYRPDRPMYAEIAMHLGIPEGSIGPTRNRCLQKLRDLLYETGF